jgi:hypothetical protein
MFMRIRKFIIPDLFNPKVLLEKNMIEYISYMEEIINRIFFTCMFVVIAVPIISWWFDKGNWLECTLSIYSGFFRAGIVFTLAILFVQSCVARKHKQISIDLEKANKAIDLLYQWSKDSNADMLLARKIVDRLNDSETTKLVSGNVPINISKSDYEMLRGFLPQYRTGLTPKSSATGDEDKDAENCQYASKCPVADSVELSMADTLWLRSWVVKYLNIMEAIMYAWKADIVDRNIIEKEFGYLVNSERDGSVVLGKYRELSGQENYPGIYSFCNEMGEKNKKRIEEIKVYG